MKERWRNLVKRLVPPAAYDVKRWLTRERPEWEVVPEGWERAATDESIHGWNVPEVVDAYVRNWNDLTSNFESPRPLGVTDPGDPENFFRHNVLVSFAYVLALSARLKTSMSILDWGGGLGQYGFLSRVLLPDTEIRYHCRDLSLLTQRGKALFPNAEFHNSNSCLQQRYDLVLASGSLQYTQAWKGILGLLAAAAAGYLYVTRVPVVSSSPSFVVLQRAERYGYETSFLGWVFNRSELLRHTRSLGMDLVREFLVSPPLAIRNTPEPVDQRGFLFRPRP